MKITEITVPPLGELKSSWRRGELAHYEYHCYQGHDSADAQLWYRSHQPVTVMKIVFAGSGRTAERRIANGEPRVYQVRFSDGHVGDVFEDELLVDPRFYQPEYCPPPETERRIVESVASSPEYPEYLYHGTSRLRVTKILRQGVSSPSWWGTERIAEYYGEVQSEEDGSDPIMLTVPLTAFQVQHLEPDGNSIAEPLTYTLGRKEDDLYAEWQASGQTWLDCLDIYESVIYRGGPIKVKRAQVSGMARSVDQGPKDRAVQKGKPVKPASSRLPPPDTIMWNIYRGILAKIYAGTPLSDNDQFMKDSIEKNFDVLQRNGET